MFSCIFFLSVSVSQQEVGGFRRKRRGRKSRIQEEAPGGGVSRRNRSREVGSGGVGVRRRRSQVVGSGRGGVRRWGHLKEDVGEIRL